MSVIPCDKNAALEKTVREFAETLKADAHTIGTHGLTETDFYQGGVFRGAIERIRGQFSATMRTKREFIQLVLEHMQDHRFITDWHSSGGSNRHDYSVTMPSGKVSVIELKGCLDGNNTNIFERPAHAQEFIIWSVCNNPAGSPRRNVWSGIHTRLSAEIVDKEKPVDGLIVWDWLCGTIARPCPKLKDNEFRRTAVGQYRLPPPCIYLFPRSIPSVRNSPSPEPHALENVEFLHALHKCFLGADNEVNRVQFTVGYKGTDVMRTTSVERDGAVQITSAPTPIRRR